MSPTSPEPQRSVEDRLRARGIAMGVSVREAQIAVAAALVSANPAIERVGLPDALARRLAEDVLIAHALPPFTQSAMDGYACRHVDLLNYSQAGLTLIGESRAGGRFVEPLGMGECVRISTGAMLPSGADTVVIQENCVLNEGRIQVRGLPRAGANVRVAGEECAPGSRLLARNSRLDARALALAASAGRVELRVFARPRVAIISTGDELATPGKALAPGQIYDSNAALLCALLHEVDAHPLPPGKAAADDPERLLHALSRASAAADLVITTGGASVGDHDHLPRLLAEHGSVHFWRVRMKPGMPVLFGEFAGKPVLVLPGNPVSVYVSFRVLAHAAIQALQGQVPVNPVRWRARLSQPWSKSHRRAEFVRGVYRIDASGQLWVRPLNDQESHRSISLMQANVLLILPEAAVDLPVGALVEIEPLFAAVAGETDESN